MERPAIESGTPNRGGSGSASTENPKGSRWRYPFSGHRGRTVAKPEKVFLRHNVWARAFPKVIALVSEPADARLAHISEWVGEIGGSLAIAEASAIHLRSMPEILGRFDFCIVDADLLGDAEDTIDYCFRLRAIAPEMPILLLSSEVRGHDLTAERMAICDATLRMPVARLPFFEGVDAAVRNSVFRLQRTQERQAESHA